MNFVLYTFFSYRNLGVPVLLFLDELEYFIWIFWFQFLQKIGEGIGRGKDSFCGGMWSAHKHLFQCSEAALVDGKCGCC